MSPKKKAATERRPVWQGEGPAAIQLFRDIYFEKYPLGTRASTVHKDPTRKDLVYNPDGFSRKYRTFIETVREFKRFGTGLTDSFRDKAKLSDLPPPEDRGPNFAEQAAGRSKKSENNENNDNDLESEDDSDYKEEDDEAESFDDEIEDGIDSVISKAEVESILAKLSIADKKKGGIPVVFNMPRAVDTSTASDIPLLAPQLVNCQGGVLAGYVPLLTGVDYEFMIGGCKKQLIQRIYIPQTYQNATHVFYRHGLSLFNVYIAGVQENMDKQKKKMLTSESNKLYHESVLFNLPYEIEPSFYDEKGNEVNKIFEGKGPSGLLWAFFYLKKKHEDDRTPRKAVGFDRDHKRESDDNGFAYRNVASNNADLFTTFQPNVSSGLDVGATGGMPTVHTTNTTINPFITPPTQHQQQQQQKLQQLQEQYRAHQQQAVQNKEQLEKLLKEKTEQALQQEKLYQQQIADMQKEQQAVKTAANDVRQEALDALQKLAVENSNTEEGMTSALRVNHQRMSDMEQQLQDFVSQEAGRAQSAAEQQKLSEQILFAEKILQDQSERNKLIEKQFQEEVSRREYELYQTERQLAAEKFPWENVNTVADQKQLKVTKKKHGKIPSTVTTDSQEYIRGATTRVRAKNTYAVDDESMKTSKSHLSSASQMKDETSVGSGNMSL